MRVLHLIVWCRVFREFGRPPELPKIFLPDKFTEFSNFLGEECMEFVGARQDSLLTLGDFWRVFGEAGASHRFVVSLGFIAHCKGSLNNSQAITSASRQSALAPLSH